MTPPLLARAAAVDAGLRTSNDRVLIALAAAGIGVSVAAAVVGALGLLPSGIIVVVVIGASTIALRVALLLRTRRSSALSNARVMNVVSLVGLGLSVAATIATLVVLFRAGGDPVGFLEDVGLHAWTLALVVVAAAAVRTTGWRVMAGVAIGGFLGASGLSRTVGVPIVATLGVDNLFATSIWVPVTEELFKALPVAVIVLIAARDRRGRPSAIDMAGLGAFSGAGSTLMENGQFGRLFVDWGAALPFSVVFPTMQRGDGPGLFDVVAGHTVWTALFCMGLGFGVLYFRRFRFAWVAIPATFFVVVFEHGVGNALVPIPFGGMAAVLALVVGFGALVWFERRPLRGRSRWRDGIRVTATTAGLRREALASIQVVRVVPTLSPIAEATR